MSLKIDIFRKKYSISTLSNEAQKRLFRGHKIIQFKSKSFLDTHFNFSFISFPIYFQNLLFIHP